MKKREQKQPSKMLKQELQKMRVRDKYLLKKYGISLIEYEDLLEAQGGACAICKRPPLKNRLSVDHLHTKDKKGKQVRGDKSTVRGLCCMFCNHKILGAIERRNVVKPYDVLLGVIEYFNKYPIKGGK